MTILSTVYILYNLLFNKFQSKSTSYSKIWKIDCKNELELAYSSILMLEHMPVIFRWNRTHFERFI